jgi:hypothetical protein
MTKEGSRQQVINTARRRRCALRRAVIVAAGILTAEIGGVERPMLYSLLAAGDAAGALTLQPHPTDPQLSTRCGEKP